jgi:hypothetical protein
MKPPPIPLSGWADAELEACVGLSGSSGIAALSGAALLGERAALSGFSVPGRRSAGGGCRLYATAGAHVALNLSRPDDRTLLPALFGDASVDPDDDAAMADRISREDPAGLVARGRTLGLAIAALDETPVSPPWAVTVQPQDRASLRPTRPLVIDLSALWAGPLATSLLRLAGAEVVKVESRTRPDSMRTGDPALFGRLNHGKASVAVDLRAPSERDALISLIRRAQIVVEASRPRALRQLGIDADALVRETPGLIWITITGHGVSGEAADWIGFGDDCGVAGGLSAALRDATGQVGFVGDAAADPLTGIYAARTALARYRSGLGGRLLLSMSGIAAEALAAERRRDARALTDALDQWAQAVGRPFPAVASREVGRVAALGEDNPAWLTS